MPPEEKIERGAQVFRQWCERMWCSGGVVGYHASLTHWRSRVRLSARIFLLLTQDTIGALLREVRSKFHRECAVLSFSFDCLLDAFHFYKFQEFTQKSVRDSIGNLVFVPSILTNKLKRRGA